jgi:hypothetical protein
MYGLDSNGNPNGSPVFWVEPDPSNPNRMFASIANSTNGGIYVCNDINDGANAVWTMLNQPPRTLGHPGVITFLDDGTLLCSFEACYTGVFTASSGVFSGVYNASTGQMTWTDCCANYPNMQYYTKDVVVDPNDSTQNTWYAGVCDGWGGNGNDMGGLYKTTNRGQSWTRLTNNAGTVSCTFNPSNPAEMYVTTIENGLYYASDANTGTPTFSPVTAYPFRAPRRVYYNPYNNNEVWVLSDGNGIRVGNTSPTATLTTIKVTPGPVAVGAGGQQAFTATAYDLNNNLLSAQPTFSWSVSGGGSIASAGVFTAGNTTGGPFIVTADANGVYGFASLTVIAASKVTSITVSPSSASVAAGGTQTFTAIAYDQYGQALSQQPTFSWSVSGGGIIDEESGLFTAGTTIGGPYTVTASASGIDGTASVIVTAASTRIAITPSSASVVAGGTQTFSAALYDQNNDLISPQPTFTWNVSGGGNISSAGVFTAENATGGSYAVTASANGINGTAAVTIFAPPSITTVPVLPGLIVAGTSISLNASASDPAGGSLAYNWNFGDSSPSGSGAAVNHAYSTPGTYTLTLTITSSSSGGTTVFTEQVVVKSPLLALTLSKLSGAVVFSSQNKDSCQFSGIISGLPKGFNPLNLQATVLIGAASTVFTLDKNGHGHNASGSFALTLKHQRDPATKQQIFPGGNVKVQGKLMHGTWSQEWGFAVNSFTPVTLSVEIDINGNRYGATATIKCAKNSKGAKFDDN